MIYKNIEKKYKSDITDLFTSVFTQSEGADEGALVGSLVAKLCTSIDDKEVICFAAYDGNELVGTVFCTHLNFGGDEKIYMLAPVAVSTEHQGKGVGQGLINHALNKLKERSVEVVVTYGDPAYYSKVGFQALPEGVLQAPLTLSIPEGWLGQSLLGKAIPVISQRPTCVKEFNDSVYW